jgi:hypothetical protein
MHTLMSNLSPVMAVAGLTAAPDGALLLLLPPLGMDVTTATRDPSRLNRPRAGPLTSKGNSYGFAVQSAGGTIVAKTAGSVVLLLAGGPHPAAAQKRRHPAATNAVMIYECRWGLWGAICKQQKDMSERCV